VPETVASFSSSLIESNGFRTAHFSPASPPAIPDYELLRLIGQGSYGQVWLARSVTGALRAIKIVYRASFDHDRPFEREFEGIKKFEPLSQARETQVAIFHVGRNDTAGYFYYVMELADDAANSQLPIAPSSMPNEKCSPRFAQANVSSGEHNRGGVGNPMLNAQWNVDTYTPHTLKHSLKSGPLPLPACLQIAQSLATALDHLHTHNLVHRDIKPSNIIFVNGRPKLADIGLVTSTDATRSFAGTDGYIPPEGPGTPRADLYSLGKVLYECVTGKNRSEFPELPNDWRTHPDRDQLLEFNEILTKACDFEPKQRYQNSIGMRAELHLLQQGQSVKHTRRLQGTWRVCKALCLPFAGLILVIALGFAFRSRLLETDLHSAVAGVDELIAHANLQMVNETQERLDLALDDLNEAVAKDPEFPLAYVSLFEVHLLYASSLGNTSPEAEARVRLAATNLIRIAPDLAEARMARSYLKYREGHLDGALADAREAAKMRLGSKENGGALVHNLSGFYLENAGRLDEALRELLTAARASKVFFSPLINRQIAQTYYLKRNFPKALEYINQSLRLESRQVLGYWVKGCILEEIGDFHQAILELEKYDSMRGSDQTKTKLLSAGLAKAIDADPVQGYWKERLNIALRDAPQEDRYIGSLLAHLGRTAEAYERLERACEKGELNALWFDVCWDHKDERFRRIAEKIELKP
jgi:Tfp pilus assembly protein PilF